ARFKNVIMYSPSAPYTVMSQSGDSGAPVVDANTGAAVALNFAGNSAGIGFGNRIADVLSALQVSLCDSVSGSPAPTQYQLTTSVNPVGGGSVNPDCSSGCWFDSGVSPSLTAIANAGYTFSSWSGAISSTVNPTTVTMNGPITITANFIGTTSLPNLTPYQPAGWSDEIVVSNRRGTPTDSSPLYSTNTLYVDWAVLNNGTAATNKTFYTRLYLDGVQKASWYYSSTLSPNYYTYIRDYPIGRLSKGTHTIQIITDSTGVLPESNEFDNEYIKTITVK
ncbi:MAG: CARDB domain-containing protein, partial [Nitrospirota bacterium]|nr:CARDB domain-containing protein [Nitrospirota bacterium]